MRLSPQETQAIVECIRELDAVTLTSCDRKNEALIHWQDPCFPELFDSSSEAGALRDSTNSWGFRIPSKVTGEISTFSIQFAWDEDSDGMACEYRTISCYKY